MEKKEPTTIKGYTMKYARNYNIELSEEEYTRYYRQYLRKFGGWGSKFHMAMGIIDAIRRDRQEEANKEAR